MSYKSIIVCDFCGAEEVNGKDRPTFFTVSGQENGKSVSYHMCSTCFTVAKIAIRAHSTGFDNLFCSH